jgi:hypothetical protein
VLQREPCNAAADLLFRLRVDHEYGVGFDDDRVEPVRPGPGESGRHLDRLKAKCWSVIPSALAASSYLRLTAV